MGVGTAGGMPELPLMPRCKLTSTDGHPRDAFLMLKPTTLPDAVWAGVLRSLTGAGGGKCVAQRSDTSVGVDMCQEEVICATVAREQLQGLEWQGQVVVMHVCAPRKGCAAPWQTCCSHDVARRRQCKP